MNDMKTAKYEEKDNLVILTRRLKEENASKHDFNVRAIGEAARKKQNKALTVSREAK